MTIFILFYARTLRYMSFLEVLNLHANIDEKEILTGLNLSLKKGEVHAIMGPNGSGKSTFANILLGDPKYSLTAGDILVKGGVFEIYRPTKGQRKGYS